MIHYHPFSPVSITPTAKEQSVEPLLLCGLAKLDEWRVSACLAVRYHLVIVEEFIIMRRAPPLILPEPLSTRKVKKTRIHTGKGVVIQPRFSFPSLLEKITTSDSHQILYHIYPHIQSDRAACLSITKGRVISAVTSVRRFCNTRCFTYPFLASY